MLNLDLQCDGTIGFKGKAGQEGADNVTGVLTKGLGGGECLRLYHGQHREGTVYHIN